MAFLNEDYSSYSAAELEAKKRQILSLTADDVRDEFVSEANLILKGIKMELKDSLNKSIRLGIVLLVCILISSFVIYNCINSPFKIFIIASLTICCAILSALFIRDIEKLKMTKLRLSKSESEVSALKNTLLSEKDLLVFKMHCFELIEESIIEASQKE